jgi:O-antigen/teichoic acid export membrane protein
MPAKDIGLATAAISSAALIVGLSRLGLDAGLIRYLPESKNKNGLYSTIVMVTLVLALVLSIVFMLGINIFSPALSFLREGWFLPVFFAYIAVTSIYSVQNMAFISIRRADLSLIQNLLLGARIPIQLLIAGMGVFGVFSSLAIAYLLTLGFGAFVLRYRLSLSMCIVIASI